MDPGRIRSERNLNYTEQPVNDQIAWQYDALHMLFIYNDKVHEANEAIEYDERFSVPGMNPP